MNLFLLQKLRESRLGPGGLVLMYNPFASCAVKNRRHRPEIRFLFLRTFLAPEIPDCTAHYRFDVAIFLAVSFRSFHSLGRRLVSRQLNLLFHCQFGKGI